MARPGRFHVALGSNAAACLVRGRVAAAAEILVFDDGVFGVHLQSEAGRVWFHEDGALIRR